MIPDDFQPDDALKPPDLSSSPHIALTQWNAWQTPDHAAKLVTACFDVRTESWADDADDLALGKLNETVTGTAVRSVGSGDLAIVATKRLDPGIERTWAGRGMPHLDARATQGFTLDARGHVLRSCFVLCGDAREPSRCENAVREGSLPSSFVAPPPPSAGLRILVTLVHHPSQTAWGLVLLAILGGAVAIATRKRPGRRRIDSR